MRRRSSLASCMLLLALVVSSSFLVLGCGGGGSGAYTTITFDNVSAPAGGTIVQVDFSFSGLSGIPDRVENVNVPPGASITYGFSQFESDNFFDVVITWDDTSTDTIPLFLVSGADFTYPVSN